MPSFSDKSRKILGECHEDLQTICNELIKWYDFTVLCGHRGQEDQEQAFRSGNTKVHWPNSMHNKIPALAVDLAPYPINWNDTKAFCYLAGAFNATAKMLFAQGKITHDIRWGGDFNKDYNFNNDKFVDLPHQELIT